MSATPAGIEALIDGLADRRDQLQHRRPRRRQLAGGAGHVGTIERQAEPAQKRGELSRRTDGDAKRLEESLQLDE